jgi:hypothetical protein
MRFYTGQHQFYCGIDLHTRTLSLGVIDSSGAIRLETTLPRFRDNLVVGCECLCARYWRAEFCAAVEPGMDFIP